jgi:hypothetical protein
MAVPPKSLVNIGAGFLSARAATRLVKERNNGAAQEAVFTHLIPYLAQGYVWAQAGIEAGMKYPAFRAKVPLQTHEDLARHIESVKQGAEDVLWPGRCQLFASSAGTTTGTARHVPVTEVMLAHFRRAALDSVLWYAARFKHTQIFKGRHLFLGGSAPVAPLSACEPGAARAGDLGSIMEMNLPRWAQKHYAEPGAAIAQMTDWPAKIAAMAEHTSKLDIRLVAGIPSWLIVLAEALRLKATGGIGAQPTLRDLWPNLECLVHGGMPNGPFHDELRALVGQRVHFHEVYPATEGFIAAQDAEASDGLRVMADTGIFFEFLPMAEYDAARLHLLGPKAVPLGEVEAGVDYAVILTTPAGLARYFLGDIVRFVSTEPARLIYVGRTKLELNAFEEHVIEKNITDALLAVCRHNGWTIVNFHVAPFFQSSSGGRARGRHEWWVELRAGTTMTPTGPIIAPELDTELRRLNKDYDAKRAAGIMEAPYVRLVMPGVFAQWMRHHGKWGGQNRMPRCRADRVIADDLGGALQFAKD